MSGPLPTADDVDAVLACYASGWLSLGPRTAAFEDALAGRCGVRHAVAVSSATAAAHLALRAVGVAEGSEVVVAAAAGPAGAAAVRLCGAVPVPLGRELHGRELDGPSAGEVARAITPRTAAVVGSHVLGLPADLRGLRELCDGRGLPLVEDATEALGARTADGRPCGSVGDVACLSFSAPGPVDVGSGGAVLTDADAPAQAVRSWRSHAMTSGTWDRHHGRQQTYDIVDIGHNYRLDEPRAVLGLARLGHLDQVVATRRAAVEQYRRDLRPTGLRVAASEEAVARASPVGVSIEGPGEGSTAAAHLPRRGGRPVLPVDVTDAERNAIVDTLRS